MKKNDEADNDLIFNSLKTKYHSSIIETIRLMWRENYSLTDLEENI